jgi:hypothetical protein
MAQRGGANNSEDLGMFARKASSSSDQQPLFLFRAKLNNSI